MFNCHYWYQPLHHVQCMYIINIHLFVKETQKGSVFGYGRINSHIIQNIKLIPFCSIRYPTNTLYNILKILQSNNINSKEETCQTFSQASKGTRHLAITDSTFNSCLIKYNIDKNKNRTAMNICQRKPKNITGG